MSFALVAHTGSAALGGPTTGAINTTGADLIVIAVSFDGGTTEVVSDSKSNTWTALTAKADAAANKTRFYYCVSPTVGSGHTFTVARSGGGNNAAAINVAAFSGVKLASPFDQQNGATEDSGAATLSTGSVTPSEANELVVASLGFDAARTIAVNGGFTISDQQNFSGGSNYGNALAYLIQTSIAAANPAFSWTTNTTAAAVIATFKAAAGSGATAFTLTGPSAGPANANSSNFTVTPTGGVTSGTFTPTAIGGVSYTPATLTWSGDAAAKTFTVNKTAAGTINVNGTFSDGLTPPANVSYTAKATTTRPYTVDGGTPSVTTDYTIKNNDATVFGARTSTSVVDQGGGTYSIAAAVVPTDLAGVIVWDQASTIFASEVLDNQLPGSTAGTNRAALPSGLSAMG
jgi:hypothetical protein